MPIEAKAILNAHRVEELIRAALERIKSDIEVNMTGKRRNASGDSVRSLNIKTTGVGGVLEGSRSFGWMEQGRGGGRVPARFQRIIREWIIDKGIPLFDGQSAGDAAYHIAKKIEEEGTRLHREGRRDDIYGNSIEREIRKLGDDIITDAASDFMYIAENFLN